MKNIALIGYSGHAYVVYEIFASQGQIVSVYTETEEKNNNPYSLKYLGNESEQAILDSLKNYLYFVSVGDNLLRKKISEKLIPYLGEPEIALHKSAIISKTMHAGHGNMFAAGVIINPQVRMGNGVICNTGCIIEHECVLGDYVHIAPGAVLCGNVQIGEGSFIGANAVIKQGVRIGKNVIIGAGTVVLKDIADHQKVVGNPQHIL